MRRAFLLWPIFAGLRGGTLEVESEPRKGSTFTLRLPVQEEP